MIPEKIYQKNDDAQVNAMPVFAYTIITHSELYVVDSPQKFYDSLYYRYGLLAEVNRFKSVDEANAFMSQKYPYYAFCVPNGNVPVALPKFGSFSMEIDPAQQALAFGMPIPPQTPQPYPTMLPMQVPGNLVGIPQILPNNPEIPNVWAIDCLNGYGIVSGNLSNFVETMVQERLVAPHAVLCFDEGTASRVAYHEYIRRFYCRYDGRHVHPMAPYRSLKAGDIVYDPAYEEREKAFTASDTQINLLLQGLL